MKSLTDQIREILGDAPTGDAVTHHASFEIEPAAFEPGDTGRPARVAVILAGPPSMGMAAVVTEILARHPDLVDTPVVLTEADVAQLGEANPLLKDFDGDHPALIDRICRDQLAVAEAHRKGMVLVIEDDLRRSMAESALECIAPTREPVFQRHRDWEGRDPCRNKHLRRGSGKKGRRR